MSEKQLNRQAKIVVLTPLVILLTVLLFMSSCASTCQFKDSYSYKNRNNCPAYR